MWNKPITDNISAERTETTTESTNEGAEICTEVTPEMATEGEGNAAENAFHSSSELMEGISETQEEDGTDHTIRIEQEVKESTYEFNTGGETAMETVNPKVRIGSHGEMVGQFGTAGRYSGIQGTDCYRHPGDVTKNPREIQSAPRR